MTDDRPRAPRTRRTPRPDSHRRDSRRVRARAAVVVPPITYPPDLPVSERREDIAAAIRDHQVVIVSGETGSGKTTQLPKIALELGRGRAGQIGHTQPRRIAARTVAERISEEITGRTDQLGGIVGYQVRFTDQSADHTLVKVMTDGILLAQIQRDPELRGYDTLIIDEAHERSLQIDFLLGYLTNLLPRRPDLKLVITSATIDSERFAAHFAGPDGTPAPVIEVTGRTYPVEIRYRPLVPEQDDDGADGTGAVRGSRERDLPTALCEAVDELTAEGPGDVLAFFSGEREIRDAADALTGHLGPRLTDPRRPDAVELLPLYGRQSAAEQHRVFARHATRRIVLATNVAETSLTVPGIRYVIDTGTARISRFSKSSKVQRLPIEPISQASANQRSGRCGRVADGIAIRLYSEQDFDSRPEFTEPEILRTSLAAVILQMIAVGVARSPEDVATFPFVDAPDTRAVRDGVTLLRELAAVEADDDGVWRLTETGRALAELPVDPRLARMVVEAGRRGVAREVMVIAAALSIQDPRERPAEQRAQADQLHARFADPTSDFLAYLNLWQYLRERQHELSGSAFRRLVRSEYLHYLRIREWQDVVAQLRQLARPLHIPVTPEPKPGAEPGAVDADAIHQSLLAGLLSQVGMVEATDTGKGRQPPSSRRARGEYRGARGTRFAVWPGSGLARRTPSWVMAGELVETSRLWAREVAAIRPEWAEELGAHLVSRTYSEPSWSTKQGAAMAFETVLLYGLPVVSRRRVLYARVDPEHARELFIRHALVGGGWTTHHRFWAANRELLAEAAELEARARRRDLVDEDAIFTFFDERIPADVVSARHFDTWWKSARRESPDLLTFPRSLVIPDDDVGHLASEQFPTAWPQGDLELAVSYQFQPGAAADGVTVHVPLAVLPRVRAAGFDWLVPGLLDELVVATVRSLPKPVRVQLVPAPDVAREVMAWLDARGVSWQDTVRAGDAAPSFADSFAAAVRALRGVVVPAEAFDASRLPDHLRVTFRVEDTSGGRPVVLGEGQDLVVLQRELAGHAADAVRAVVRAAARESAGAANAPAATSTSQSTSTAHDSADADSAAQDAAVQLDPHTVAAAHREGVRRRLLGDVRLAPGRVTSRWPATAALNLAASRYPSTEALVEDLQLAVVDAALVEFLAGRPSTVLDADAEYAALLAGLRDRFEDEVFAVALRAADVLAAYRQLDGKLRATSSLALLATASDIRSHADALVAPGFVSRAGAARLADLVRYLRADSYRLAKGAENPDRDSSHAWQVAELENELAAVRDLLLGRVPTPDALPTATRAALDDVGWLIEELRVSIFAQQLGTARPASPQRIRKALAAVAARRGA